MSEIVERELTEADKIEIFKLATRGLQKRYAEQIRSGMTDGELDAALASVLGIFGGSGGPDRFSISHAGNGLRIWGGCHVVNHVQEKPLFEGKRTIAKAREVYVIPDPENDQMSLF